MLATKWKPECAGADNSLPVDVHGEVWSVTSSLTWTVRDCGLSADSLCPRTMPVPGLLRSQYVRGCGLFVIVPVGAD
ncbi:MAG: hypothetical protein DME23_26170 [Verrucomicrobia bacterium]|nr:MAG: hypothetical protein DME23_26170 [Verrucomicrobiota bacterium]